jgi:hypothetical protein
MPNEPTPSGPLKYGVEINFDEEQRKQLDELANDPTRRQQADDEMQAALAQFHATVRGVLDKHGVKGIKDNQITPSIMVVHPTR